MGIGRESSHQKSTNGATTNIHGSGYMALKGAVEVKRGLFTMGLHPPKLECGSL